MPKSTNYVPELSKTNDPSEALEGLGNVLSYL